MKRESIISGLKLCFTINRSTLSRFSPLNTYTTVMPRQTNQNLVLSCLVQTKRKRQPLSQTACRFVDRDKFQDYTWRYHIHSFRFPPETLVIFSEPFPCKSSELTALPRTLIIPSLTDRPLKMHFTLPQLLFLIIDPESALPVSAHIHAPNNLIGRVTSLGQQSHAVQIQLLLLKYGC